MKHVDCVDCVSPNDGRLLDRVPISTHDRFAEVLARMGPRVVPWEARAPALRELARAISAAKESFAQIIVNEAGKTREEALGEVDYAGTFLDAAAAWVDAAPRADTSGAGSSVTQVPIGLALLVVPYNDPLAGITRKIAPAIAAGCPALIKPSPLGWLCARRLEEIVPSALEPYVQFAFFDDPADIAGLVRAEEVAIVSMTGSTPAGRAIAAAAAARPVPAILELGGNCPFVVFPDADIRQAARDLLERKVRAAGQACSSVNRVLVHAHIQQRFCNQLADLLPSFVCGRSDRDGVKYGPVRTRAAVSRLDALEAQCLRAGAAVFARGPLQAETEHSFCRPLSILVADGPNLLDTEETFGPLLMIQPFDDDAHLDAAFARNRQRLVAYFYGFGGPRFITARPALRFGSIGINTTRIQGADIPTGGFGTAGYGREGGAWGIEEFRTTVNLRSA